MLWNCDHAPSLDEAHRKMDPAGRSAQRTASSSWPIATTLRTMCDAWREGLAAHRQYEHLRSRGIPHESAIREALGIGLTPSQETREAAKPLYLAGNA